MRYAELHCKTNFTFLTGAAHADELVPRAADLAYAALAITDRETLSGVVRAHVAAKECEFPLIIGAEVHPTDGPPACLWATDRRAYGRLSRLLTVGRRRAEKGKCELRVADIAEYQEGLLAGVIPGEVLPDEAATKAANWHAYRDIFGDRAYLLAELFRGADDAGRLARLKQLSKGLRLPLVAAGDVHYHIPARQVLHEVVSAIRLGTTIAEIGRDRYANAQRHLRPIEEIETLFATAPDAIARTLEIAGRCHFSLSELRYEYPEELAPPGYTPATYLAELTWQGADIRYPAGVPAKVRTLLEHELQLIHELHYEAYFLTVWDLVRYARERGILCQGRGSAANSAVCYCLGVTSVDPDRADVLFERFVSKERDEAPDIDVDFEHERREEVLQYLYDKYGRERAGLTAVVITYRIRSAIRDAGKALGLSLDRVDALSKNIEGRVHEDRFALRCTEVGIDPESELGRRLVYVISQLCGFPRHLSQHVGGMVITQGPLCELAPIENAAMEGRTVIEWDKDDLDELGILKVDCLCLGMLSAIRKCFQLVHQHYPDDRNGEMLTLANLPAEDPHVYDMICKADTIGVFQIESRAQMSMLPRLKPREYYDLVIEVAIVRPGPIQGQMVHPYLRRRNGQEGVTYPNEAIRAVLHKTLGVPLFQEQAMKLAVVAAGFTPGEADQLRRAMGAWRRPGIIDQFRLKLIEGMRQRGLSEEFAAQVFNQIRGFGEYGFPESHAASFALLVYVSAWIKCYYPAVFAAGIINSQPMGFYAPSQLIRDARAHDVRVLPVDVNASDWDCTLEPIVGGELALRLGFRLLQGLQVAAVEKFIQTRATGGAFTSLADFTQRTSASRALLARLAEADVFSSLQLDRRAALWQALAEEKQPPHQPLLKGLDDEEPAAELPPMPLSEQVFEDYRTAGLSLKSHPIAFHREALEQLKVTRCTDLDHVNNGRQVRVGGLIILRQRPATAKGITFVTLEDETGVANLVLRPEIWERYYAVARRSNAWIAHGKLEKRDTVIHVVVNRLEDLSQALAGLSMKSRDFR